MKSYLRSILQLSLITTFSLIPIGCTGHWIGGELHPRIPPEPDEKNIAYYQDSIAENNNNINNCQEWINDIDQELKAGETTKEEATEAKDWLNAEINFYHSQINEYQYQILLLKGNGTITIVEKAEAVICLSEKINYLNQELALKTKYPGDYSQEDLQAITNKIKNTQKILEEILKIEEGD